jgi:hypothetical protein
VEALVGAGTDSGRYPRELPRVPLKSSVANLYPPRPPFPAVRVLRQGALFAFECLSETLGILFEPYVIRILPALLKVL